MLVELGLVEQRYKAVCEVLDGATVIDVAERNGVTRQTVHPGSAAMRARGSPAWSTRPPSPSRAPTRWPRWSRPASSRCVEPIRVGDRGPSAPTWPERASRRCPGRSSIYRALVRHRLLEPTPRKRARSDYKRWERSKSMELWQMDIVGRLYLVDGTEVKVVTGVDDHSRYCVCARIVARAMAKPVCDALTFSLEEHGPPDEILTDIQAG